MFHFEMKNSDGSAPSHASPWHCLHSSSTWGSQVELTEQPRLNSFPLHLQQISATNKQTKIQTNKQATITKQNKINKASQVKLICIFPSHLFHPLSSSQKIKRQKKERKHLTPFPFPFFISPGVFAHQSESGPLAAVYCVCSWKYFLWKNYKVLVKNLYFTCGVYDSNCIVVLPIGVEGAGHPKLVFTWLITQLNKFVFLVLIFIYVNKQIQKA